MTISHYPKYVTPFCASSWPPLPLSGLFKRAHRKTLRVQENTKAWGGLGQCGRRQSGAGHVSHLRILDSSVGFGIKFLLHIGFFRARRPMKKRSPGASDTLSAPELPLPPNSISMFLASLPGFLQSSRQLLLLHFLMKLLSSNQQPCNICSFNISEQILVSLF